MFIEAAQNAPADTATQVTQTAQAVQNVAEKLPDLSDLAKDVLVQSITAVKNGATWLQGQIPEVLTQLLHWKLAEGLIIGIVQLVLSIFLLYSTVKIFTNRWDWSDGVEFVGIVTMLGSIFTFLFSLGHFLDVVKIIIAPKVYLLEYAASLVKS